MDCQRCKQRPANVHITQFINGEKQETHLCDQCAQEVKINLEFPQYPMSNLSNLLSFLTYGNNSGQRLPESKCPNCHNAYRKIAELGYVGCSECYRHFASQIEPVLKKIHGANRHVGKVPRRMGATLLLKREINDYNSALKKAIAREDYEEAARLRDLIKKMEEKARGDERND